MRNGNVHEWDDDPVERRKEWEGWKRSAWEDLSVLVFKS